MKNDFFQQKENEGFFDKELAKEVIKELAKKYRQDNPNGGNVLSLTRLYGDVATICRISAHKGINISTFEVLSEIIKGFYNL